MGSQHPGACSTRRPIQLGRRFRGIIASGLAGVFGTAIGASWVKATPEIGIPFENLLYVDMQSLSMARPVVGFLQQGTDRSTGKQGGPVVRREIDCATRSSRTSRSADVAPILDFEPISTSDMASVQVANLVCREARGRGWGGQPTTPERPTPDATVEPERHSESRPPAPAPAPAFKSIAVHATPPFSLTDDAIKPNTRGIDVDAVLTSIRKQRAPTKNEFETNAEFNQRVRRFGSTLPRPIAEGARFAIIQAVSSFPELHLGGDATATTTYSPETEVMSITLTKGWMGCLPLQRTMTPKGKYVAKNAFGHQVTVISVDVSEICIDISEDSPAPAGADIAFSIDVPRTSASKLKSRLAFAVIGQVVPPFATVTRDREAPTMRRPVELQTVQRALRMSIADVWLVDIGTGVVLAKHTTPLTDSKPLLVGGFDANKTCSPPSYRKREVPNFDLVAELEVRVAADGSVAGVVVTRSTGIAELDDRTVSAAWACVFRPGTNAGQPVDGVATVKFHFDEAHAREN